MAQSDIAAAFKRSGFSVLNESVEGKLSQILSGLNKSAQWGAQHYEVFLSSRYLCLLSLLSALTLRCCP